MATRKTTSKAKTSKSRSTKSTVVKTPVKTVSAELAVLRKLHLISAGVFILLAALSVIFMNRSSVELIVGHMAQDSLTSSMAPAAHHLFDLEVRWLSVVALTISAILPVLYLTKLKQGYETGLKKKAVAWRWIDLAVTGVIIFETIALLSGISDVISLKLIGLVIISLAVIAWLTESALTRAAFLGQNLLKLLLAIILGLPLLATSLYGMVRAPWYVYTLYGGLVVVLITSTVNCGKLLKKNQSYVTTERNYQLINLISKTAFGVILIIGFMK